MLSLLNLNNDKMRRNRTCTSRQRCDGKCRRISGWITDSQNGIDRRRFYNRHAHNLRGACRSPHDRICQIRAVECQQKLAGLINTYLEQDLIDPNLRQIKRAGSCSGNSRAAVWPVLRKADIGAGGDCCRTVRRY